MVGGGQSGGSFQAKFREGNRHDSAELSGVAELAFGEATIARICKGKYWKRGSFLGRGLQKFTRHIRESLDLVPICISVKRNFLKPDKVRQRAGG